MNCLDDAFIDVDDIGPVTLTPPPVTNANGTDPISSLQFTVFNFFFLLYSFDGDVVVVNLVKRCRLPYIYARLCQCNTLLP